ncbi:ribosome maturation factor RimM [Candidatus Erwinia haradaeae]|uniref:Ribosome maturation factor RimM n=1 Tax=Candidatus Erwinia haradaeae TaxID=1922217 RepID=A0A451DFY3_9GAMM|nr:ribosome maturation factor RimM [Candidatus Erwinia haradaeae]VFP85539.1 Ribosome maturation factor RimM [Candidatus Erwinia haradaeae]
MRVLISAKYPVDPLSMGLMGSAYGIYGWLKVFSYAEEVTNIIYYQPWFIQKGDQWYLLELEKWKRYKNQLIIKIKGIDSRNNVKENLTDYEVIVDSKHLPVLENGDFYWKDLVGCQVINIAHCILGKVVQIIATGANDVLIVHPNLEDKNHTREILIPFIEKIVIKSVNIIARIIFVDWSTEF